VETVCNAWEWGVSQSILGVVVKNPAALPTAELEELQEKAIA
jgi:hypothetical protein